MTSVNSRGGAAGNEGRGHGSRNDRERDRIEPKKKEREPTERVRDKEVAGPKGKRTRTIRRYMVQIPNSLLSQ